MNELFHIRVVSKHTKIDTLFDMGSQVNLISEALVKNMGLEMKPHLKPYPLGWVCDKEKISVTKQCRVIFSISSKLIDEVDLDFVPLDRLPRGTILLVHGSLRKCQNCVTHSSLWCCHITTMTS
jgi:hypothetical protein